MLTNKTILITGGTGSLGKVLTRRLLTGEMGKPKKILEVAGGLVVSVGSFVLLVITRGKFGGPKA